MAILITGGTKGIGLAVARRFAKPGCKIFLNYLRDDRTAEAAVAHCALPARQLSHSRPTSAPRLGPGR
jgi:NAD(P)-dependent dehydrogenase (short-subunit alcohol dehydrogenase family)